MHTAGPWQVYYGATTCQVFPVSSKKNAKADALSAVFDREGEGHANAKLISAAPDLVAALKMILHAIDWDVEKPADSYGAKAYDAAMSAIAKATA